MSDPEPQEGNASIQMASFAHNMLSILYYTCPSNYQCGGPSYAATNAVDAILHLMGIGVPMFTRHGPVDTSDFEKSIRDHAIKKESLLGGYVEHKSQILSGALHTMLFDTRRKELREDQEVTESSILSVVQWYLKKTGVNKESFIKRLQEESHDTLTQMENADPSMPKV